MATPVFSDAVLDAVKVNSEQETNRNGGKFASVYFNTRTERVVFQLGELGNTVADSTLLRVTFKPEQYEMKYNLKVDISGAPRDFLRSLEKKVIDSAIDHHWFKNATEEKVRSMFSSRLKESDNSQYPDDTFKFRINMLSDKEPTEIFVIEAGPDGALKNANGDVECTEGSIDDLLQGSMIIPVLRTKGGVYFMSKDFGISFEATSILIVKDQRGTKRKLGVLAFNLGNAKLVIAEE